jgi:hypothetical protein
VLAAEPGGAFGFESQDDEVLFGRASAGKGFFFAQSMLHQL